MALESGKYAIFSKLDCAFVGRGMIETEDTAPKRILKLPKDMGPNTTIWAVEKLPNGNYEFRARNSIVGAIDGLLFAIIVEEEIPSLGATIEWTLQRDERDTDGNAYVVMVAGQQVGWVAPTGDDGQIAVKPILVGLTIPPTFSPSEVFIFKKLDEQAE
ncbi:hypothetical protein V8D89_004107 [Ganoderma adspersum]